MFAVNGRVLQKKKNDSLPFLQLAQHLMFIRVSNRDQAQNCVLYHSVLNPSEAGLPIRQDDKWPPYVPTGDVATIAIPLRLRSGHN